MRTVTTDKNELRIVGINPTIMLHQDPSAPPTSRVSFWRSHYSPVGPGHVVFWFSKELTAGEPRIYADNPALARWLQGEIVRAEMPYKDQSLPVVEATFTEDWSLPLYVTEHVRAGDDAMSFSWYDFLPSFYGATTPEPGETHGHNACYVPAQRAQVMLNGRQAEGSPLARERDGYADSSCFLALSENWTRVREVRANG